MTERITLEESEFLKSEYNKNLSKQQNNQFPITLDDGTVINNMTELQAFYESHRKEDPDKEAFKKLFEEKFSVNIKNDSYDLLKKIIKDDIKNLNDVFDFYQGLTFEQNQEAESLNISDDQLYLSSISLFIDEIKNSFKEKRECIFKIELIDHILSLAKEACFKYHEQLYC